VISLAFQAAFLLPLILWYAILFLSFDAVVDAGAGGFSESWSNTAILHRGPKNYKTIKFLS